MVHITPATAAIMPYIGAYAQTLRFTLGLVTSCRDFSILSRWFRSAKHEPFHSTNERVIRRLPPFRQRVGR
jgi:hypothetical protein